MLTLTSELGMATTSLWGLTVTMSLPNSSSSPLWSHGGPRTAVSHTPLPLPCLGCPGDPSLLSPSSSAFPSTQLTCLLPEAATDGLATPDLCSQESLKQWDLGLPITRWVQLLAQPLTQGLTALPACVRTCQTRVSKFLPLRVVVRSSLRGLSAQTCL